ncbi:foldase protein PrsA [Paenibacillus oceani]|uniref:Peptidylprolyl isomerase n=1 Tax=Paenibacillus oceani TaxID=2772510 RepID=A0A927C7H3_9BACL|nr:peptidylprolyl isomerase [Paenibacillus oceani]MBD2861417.1 peptidylprolyl isomerase [Paenibacillus oceani]
MRQQKQNKTWMITSLVLLVLLAGVSIYAFTKNGGGGDEAVASVNGVKIGKSELFDQLILNGGSQILDSMITEELIKQEAEKAGFKVTDADLEQELASFKKGFSSDEEFNMLLMQSGMTLDEVKNKFMPMQVRLRKILGPQITITDDDMKKYYEENKEMMATPEQVKASHILVATKEESEAILAQLKGGADFATLAKEKSTDPGSKEQGGDLDYFGKGMMVKEFEDAAFSLPVGELSNVVQTSHGFHIIKVTDKKAATTPTYDQKKDDIKEELTSQKIQELSGPWMEEIKGKAKIENKLQAS